MENGVVHTDCERPTVRVTVDQEGTPEGYLDLRLVDDCPDIAAREEQVPTGEGQITQLRYSRGLGLWTARWVLEASGSELRFGEPKDGAAVVLRLQLVEPSLTGTPGLGEE